jgi:hypothetical protein
VGYRSPLSEPIGLHYGAARPILIAAAISGAANGVIATSFDGGDTWTARQSPATGHQGAAWSPTQRKVLLIRVNGGLTVTRDGTVFKTLPANLSPNSTWRDIAWWEAQRLWVAVASSGTDRVATSPTGQVWTTIATATTRGWEIVEIDPYTSRIWLGTSNNANARPLQYSDDGAAWFEIGNMPTSCGCDALAFSQSGRVLAYSLSLNASRHSDNGGATWTNVTGVVNGNSRTAAYREANDLFVAAAAGTGIYSSLGQGLGTWTLRASGAAFTGLHGLIYSRAFERFVGVKSNGGLHVAQSRNGISNWTAATHATIGNGSDWRIICEAKL